MEEKSEQAEAEVSASWGRENYKKWPWPSFLTVAISIGIIFCIASSPFTIQRSSGVSFALSLGFLLCGLILLVPSAISIVILIWIAISSYSGCYLPRCIRQVRRVVNGLPPMSKDEEEAEAAAAAAAAAIVPKAGRSASAGTLMTDMSPTTHLDHEDAQSVSPGFEGRRPAGRGYSPHVYNAGEIVLNVQAEGQDKAGAAGNFRVLRDPSAPGPSAAANAAGAHVWTVADEDYDRRGSHDRSKEEGSYTTTLREQSPTVSNHHQGDGKAGIVNKGYRHSTSDRQGNRTHYDRLDDHAMRPSAFSVPVRSQSPFRYAHPYPYEGSSLERRHVYNTPLQNGLRSSPVATLSSSQTELLSADRPPSRASNGRISPGRIYFISPQRYPMQDSPI